MSKAHGHHALARQWELLRLIPTRPPGITTAELTHKLASHGFEVTKRTVERDLAHLSLIFGLACNDKGMPYGWYWMAGESVDLPGISLTDALSLTLVESLLRPLIPAPLLSSIEPKFNSARTKLEELSSHNPSAKWADKVRYVAPSISLIPPKLSAECLSKIQEGLLTDKKIEAKYKKSTQKSPAELTLTPLGIIQRGGISYLAATAFDYSDVRLYAMHRFVEVEITELDSITNGFDLQEYINSGALQFSTGNEVNIRAKISPDFASILAETPLSTNQAITQENSETFLTATIIDSWELKWWLLSHAGDIQVLSPPHLRDNIIKSLNTAISNYS